MESLKQVNCFVRGHNFIQISLSGHKTSQRRAFERDVYDYARSLGLQRREAKREVLKARGFCGEFDHDSDVSMLGDEVDDSAQVLVDLFSRPDASQNTPHSVLTSQPESLPMKKQKQSNGKKKARVSGTNPGTSPGSISTEGLEVPTEPKSSKADKKSKKRKVADIKEGPNAFGFTTPKEKPSRKKPKKSKDKSSASHNDSLGARAGEVLSLPNRHIAKKQKLEPTLPPIDTARDSEHSNRDPQLDPAASAFNKKQKKEKTKKRDKEEKRSQKAPKLEGLSLVEATVMNDELGRLIKGLNTKDRLRKDEEKEAKREANAGRRSRKQEKRNLPTEHSRLYPEATREDSVEAPEPTLKPTNVVDGPFSHNVTTYNRADSYRKGEALAKVTEEAHVSRAAAAVANTPEPDLLDQHDAGPAVRSMYFTPEKQKPKKARASPRVKLELLEEDIQKAKTDLELRKQAREKQARLRAELVAIKAGQTELITPRRVEVNASSNPVAGTPRKQTQPTPPIAETGHIVTRDEITATTPMQTRLRKSRQSENSVEGSYHGSYERNVANNAEDTPVPVDEVLHHPGPPQSVRVEVERLSKTRGSQLTDPASTSSIMTRERPLHIDARQDGILGHEIAKAAIEPVVEESQPEHNGWIPINHATLAAKGHSRFGESCTVFGSIGKPANGHMDMDVDRVNEVGREDSTFDVDTQTSGNGKRVLRKRKSRINAVEGAEDVVVKGSKKPRNVKQEPLDFHFPMIQ